MRKQYHAETISAETTAAETTAAETISGETISAETTAAETTAAETTAAETTTEATATTTSPSTSDTSEIFFEIPVTGDFSSINETALLIAEEEICNDALEKMGYNLTEPETLPKCNLKQSTNSTTTNRRRNIGNDGWYIEILLDALEASNETLMTELQAAINMFGL